jgi:hypothetical protein
LISRQTYRSRAEFATLATPYSKRDAQPKLEIHYEIRKRGNRNGLAHYRIFNVRAVEAPAAQTEEIELLSEFGGGVDGFDKSEAAARFAAIAERLAIVGNGIEKILDYGLVSADVGYSGG